MSNTTKGLKEQNGIQGRRFGVAGFPKDESLRIAEELAELGGFSRIFTNSPVPLSPQVSNVEAFILCGSTASELCAQGGADALSAFKRPIGVVGDCDLRGSRSGFVHVLPTSSARNLVSTFGKWLTKFDQNMMTESNPDVLPLAKYRILIADDHPAIRNLVGRILSRPSMECLEALDGCQAVGLAKLVMPDLIVLDLNMPGMDGFRVLSEIRSDPGTRSASVLLLTGRNTANDIELAEQLGADMYVVKPLQINDFRTRVENLLWKEPDGTQQHTGKAVRGPGPSEARPN